MHTYFKKETFVKTYSSIINLIHGKIMWPNVDCKHPLPQIKKKRIGRPKKSRKREHDELSGRKKTKGFVLRCSYCKSTGHNKRSCNSSQSPAPADLRSSLQS